MTAQNNQTSMNETAGNVFFTKSTMLIFHVTDGWQTFAHWEHVWVTGLALVVSNSTISICIFSDNKQKRPTVYKHA